MMYMMNVLLLGMLVGTLSKKDVTHSPTMMPRLNVEY
jgi:hypothetical protein